MTIALIDADIAAFRAAAGAEKSIDWDDGEGPTLSVDPEAAAEHALITVRAWATLAGCSDIVCCFTGRNNFRKTVLPSYKMNRAGKVKPQAYAHVVHTLRQEFDFQCIEGLEADDVMGILLTTLPKYEDAVCVTLDKDLRTVPGLHFNPLKDRLPTLVTVEDADHRWMTQTLTGDTSDGYVGLPKVGPVKAAAILGKPARIGVLWPKVQAAYTAYARPPGEALQQARVARILRREDYDKTTKSVLLWHPTKPEPLALSAVNGETVEKRK